MPQILTTARFIADVQKRAASRGAIHHQAPLDEVLRLLATQGPTAQARVIHRILSGLSGKVEIFREAELELLGAKELELASALIEASIQGFCTPGDLTMALERVKTYAGWSDG